MAHLRAPSTSQGAIAFLWGLLFGVLIWLGLLSIGITKATSFILGSVAGFLVFLLVAVYGGDEPARQAGRRVLPPR
jgi:hypothetical protein